MRLHFRSFLFPVIGAAAACASLSFACASPGADGEDSEGAAVSTKAYNDRIDKANADAKAKLLAALSKSTWTRLAAPAPGHVASLSCPPAGKPSAACRITKITSVPGAPSPPETMSYDASKFEVTVLSAEPHNAEPCSVQGILRLSNLIDPDAGPAFAAAPFDYEYRFDWTCGSTLTIQPPPSHDKDGIAVSYEEDTLIKTE